MVTGKCEDGRGRGIVTRDDLDPCVQLTIQFVCVLTDLDYADEIKHGNKTWFVFLSEALQRSTQEEFCITNYYINYYKHLLQLLDWCDPHRNVDDVKRWPFVSNLLPFVPCGLVNAVKKYDQYLVKWIITVNIKFYVKIMFLRFELPDSGDDCRLSALKIGAFQNGGWIGKWYWLYCGNRPPWSETIESNNVIMVINQNLLNYRFKVSFMYYITDPNEYLETELFYRDDITHGQQEVYYQIQYIYSIKWIIKLPICYVAHFSTIKLMNFAGIFHIFDGPMEEKYSIFSLTQDIFHTFIADADTMSTYFLTVVKLVIYNNNMEFIKSHVMELYFKKKMLHKKYFLNLNSRNQVKNNGHILHAAYSITGKDKQYPNVTFDIRSFQGWNEGGCNMGGFAILHQMSDRNGPLITSGPYCHGRGSNQPLITDHGPEYIILSKSETLFVIYAFGSEYKIDLDVLISISACEGLFNSPLLCQAQLETRQTKVTISLWNNFQLDCMSAMSGDAFINIAIVRFSGCVVVQVVMCQKPISYHLEIISRVYVNFEYSSPVHHSISSGVIQLSHLYILWSSMTSGPQQIKLITGNTTLDIGEVQSLTYQHKADVPYHESSVNIIMLQKDINYIGGSAQCEIFNQSVVLQPPQTGTYDGTELMKLSSLCATGYYQYAKIYIYTIVPGYKTHRGDLSNLYLDVQEVQCSDSMAVSSALTISVRRTFSQSFQFTDNKTIEIDVPNVSIVMALEKRSVCSTLIVNYRVHEIRLLGEIWEDIFLVRYCSTFAINCLNITKCHKTK